MKQNKI